MTRISETEFAALESLERTFGLVETLVARFHVDEEAVSVQQVGRYSTGTWTIKELLDRADEVLERAKGRTL